MSAPPSGSANGSTTAGYYPDPSIPGYIRYWDGMAWVPGTSRPEPRSGESTPTSPTDSQQPPEPADAVPPAAGPQASAQGWGTPEPPPEAGPHGGVDVRPGVPQITDWDDPSRLHGNRPEPASAWQADTSRQTGFGNDEAHRVSWGSDGSGQPGAGDPRGTWRRPAAAPPGEAPPVSSDTEPERPRSVPSQAKKPEVGHAYPVRPGLPQPPAPQPASPEPSPQPAQGNPHTPPAAPTPSAGSPGRDQTTQLRRSDIVKARRAARAAAAQQGGQHAPPSTQPPGAQQAPTPQQAPAQGPGGQDWAHQVRELAQPAGGAPGQQGAPAGHQASPSEDGLAAPWRPPASDPFLRAAQNQARPAGLGRRCAARLIDTLVTVSVGAAVALPLLPKARDHIQAKIEQAEQAGVNTQIWLIDGTTGLYLAMVVGALLLFGVVYEALPNARWGRTLGKKLCGLRVLSMEEQEPPGYGRALLRWLVYGVLAALLIGVVNLLWALFDKPWRQCWHDKAAGTFTAEGGDDGELRLS